MKKYNLGLFIGRFQPFHKGHEMVVRAALEECEKLVILIGSAQESKTLRNPFNETIRKSIIKSCLFDEVYSGKVIILSINDRANPSNDSSWGEYVMDFLKDNKIEKPDVIFEGKEIERDSWYTSLGIERVIISRDDIDVSGTKLREAIFNGDRDYWDKFKGSDCDGRDFTALREILKYTNEKEGGKNDFDV